MRGHGKIINHGFIILCENPRTQSESTNLRYWSMVKLARPITDALTSYGMIALVILVALFAASLFGKGSRRRVVCWGLGFGLVMTVSALAAELGILSSQRSFPPPMALLIMAVFVGSIGLGVSRVGASVAQHAPLLGLVLLQTFRFPLELLMHHAAARQIMPVELSFSGFNYDIVTGATAAILVLVSRFRKIPAVVLWVWNAWGILCLAVIAGIAIASSPMVHAFGVAPEHVNSWVLYFPYVWLPAILVSTAMVSHVVLTRKLLAAAERINSRRRAV